jgi:hypothetical protein
MSGDNDNEDFKEVSEMVDGVVNTVKELGKNLKPAFDAARQVIENIGDEMKPVFDDIQKAFSEVIDGVKTATIEKELSYREAMEFFIKYKDTDKAIAKGAMLRENLEGGRILFIQVFLDKNNQLVCKADGTPLGRKLRVTALDGELLKVFKNSSLVVVS